MDFQLGTAAEEILPKTQKLFTITRYPIRYMVTPKCGCTFVKNLMWRLEYGEFYHSPMTIHDQDGVFPRAVDLGLTEEQVRAEDYAFMAVRKPVDRFFSLYAEKVIGEGWKRYIPLRQLLVDQYGLNPAANTPRQHTENCLILSKWIRANLKDKIDLEPEAHWTPQNYRSFVFVPTDLKVLLVSQMTEHMSVLLKPIVPDIDDIIPQLERNRSPLGVMKKDILTEELRQDVNDIYRRDWKIFFAAKQAWAKGVTTNADIPRISDIS